jgi:hypothetical protein
MNWQDMDTAPKDGTVIFLIDHEFSREPERVFIAYWSTYPDDSGEGYWNQKASYLPSCVKSDSKIAGGMTSNYKNFTPTKWHPAIQPPN